MYSVKDISEYIVALIAAFASRYDMTDMEAYKYLSKYGAIKVAHDFYDVMHTQPMDDMVQSMWSYCNRKGGSLWYMIVRVARLFCYANERDASVLWGLEGAWFHFVGSVNYRKSPTSPHLGDGSDFLLSSHLIVFTCPGAPQGAYARPGYTPAMQLVTPRAVAMAVRIEIAVWMTNRHNCLFFSSMIFLAGLRVRLMSTFLSAFGGNARTSEEDNQYNFYNILQVSWNYPIRPER